MPGFVAAAEHAYEHSVCSADGGQQKQGFFRNTAFPFAGCVFIITAYGKGSQVDCKEVNNEITHVQIIARMERNAK